MSTTNKEGLNAMRASLIRTFGDNDNFKSAAPLIAKFIEEQEVYNELARATSAVVLDMTKHKKEAEEDSDNLEEQLEKQFAQDELYDVIDDMTDQLMESFEDEIEYIKFNDSSDDEITITIKLNK